MLLYHISGWLPQNWNIAVVLIALKLELTLLISKWEWIYSIQATCTCFHKNREYKSLHLNSYANCLIRSRSACTCFRLSPKVYLFPRLTLYTEEQGPLSGSTCIYLFDNSGRILCVCQTPQRCMGKEGMKKIIWRVLFSMEGFSAEQLL